ncbi:uncharacterized protein LOC143028724 [Oratosquilla oratoria]|uniref:uncharacterized protein LOC143028724 n=1 Tax=Oratosquilla oratoria TaxID=337810 RepID=UPI003F75CC7D
MGAWSGWSPVCSEVPQGSVLSPLLFIIYINDIDVGNVIRITKFADDTKLGGNVATPESVEILRSDLEKVGKWSEEWLMPFNLAKCKTMHTRHANQRTDYSLLGLDIARTELEKDIGVLISSDPKSSEQCIEVENEVQRLLSYIRKHFGYRNQEIVLSLYNSLIQVLQGDETPRNTTVSRLATFYKTVLTSVCTRWHFF